MIIITCDEVVRAWFCECRPNKPQKEESAVFDWALKWVYIIITTTRIMKV